MAAVSFPKREKGITTMTSKGIYQEVRTNNAPHSVSATNFSFQVPGYSFSYEFGTGGWVEFLADGSLRNVSAEYVHQVLDAAITKTRGVQ